MLIEKTKKIFGKDLIQRIIDNHFALENDSEAVVELIKKVEKLNEIDDIDVIVESDLRLFDGQTSAAEMIWLHYRCAVMLMAASVGDLDGLQLDENKFEKPEEFVYKLAEFWVFDMVPHIEDFNLNLFIKKTVANIIWLSSELKI